MKKLVIIVFFIVSIIVLGCGIKDKVLSKTIGTNLTYIGDNLKKTSTVVTKSDVAQIQVGPCGWVNHTLIDKQCYIVGIGKNKQTILWNIFYDKDSLEFLKTEQLFIT